MRFIRQPAAILAVLTGLNALNYLDRFILAAILPLVIADLHLRDWQAGSLQSAFILVYSLASPLAGWLGDRRSRTMLAGVGVALWSVATVGSGLATGFAVLLFARAVVGFGEASYAVVTPSLIADLYPSARRARALSVFYAAMPAGTALGYMVGGFVGTHFGWRHAFFVAGGPGLLFALLLLLIREPRRGQQEARVMDRTPLSLLASWRALRASPSYFFNVAAQTIITFTSGGLAAWIPTYYVRERQIPLERATLLFGGILVVAGLIGTLTGGQLVDRLSRRVVSAAYLFPGLALIATLPFTLLAILSPTPAVFWPAMFMSLLLLFVNAGVLSAAMTNVLPPDMRGRGFAVSLLVMHMLGDALSPTLIGLVSDFVGLRWPVLATALMLVPAGVILLCGRRLLVADLATMAKATS